MPARMTDWWGMWLRRHHVPDTQWSSSSKCWICSRWREHLFSWNLPGPHPSAGVGVVLLHTSIDSWVPEQMHLNAAGTAYELWRMLPPTRTRYFFTVAGTKVAAKAAHGAHGLENRAAGDDPSVPSQVNFIHLGQDHVAPPSTAPNDSRKDARAGSGSGSAASAHPGATAAEVAAGAAVFHARPRVMLPPPQPVHAATPGKQRRPFDKSKSMFAQYRVRHLWHSVVGTAAVALTVFPSDVHRVLKQTDTKQLLDAAFAADWGQCKSRRQLVRGGLDQTAAVAAVLRKHYPSLKAIFRAYARPHAIPLGSFTEFCADINVTLPADERHQAAADRAAGKPSAAAPKAPGQRGKRSRHRRHSSDTPSLGSTLELVAEAAAAANTRTASRRLSGGTDLAKAAVQSNAATQAPQCWNDDSTPAAAAVRVLSASKVSKLFMGIKYAHMSSTVRGKRNPDRALTRCQFLDALVHLALEVMPEACRSRGVSSSTQGAVLSLGRVVDQFMSNHVLPHAKEWNGSQFRASMYTHEVDDVMRAQEWTLDTAFHVYCSANGNMDLSDFCRLLGDSGLLTFDFTTRDAQRVFVMSLQTIVDEMASLKFAELERVEFYEALVRVSHEAVVYSPATIAAHAKGKANAARGSFRGVAEIAMARREAAGAGHTSAAGADAADSLELTLRAEAEAYKALPLHEKLSRTLVRVRQLVKAKAGWNATHNASDNA